MVISVFLHLAYYNLIKLIFFTDKQGEHQYVHVQSKPVIEKLPQSTSTYLLSEELHQKNMQMLLLEKKLILNDIGSELQQKNENLMETINSKQKEIESINEEIRVANDKAKQAQDNNQHLTKENEELRYKIEKQQRSIDRLMEENTEIQNTAKKLEQDFETHKAFYESEITDLNITVEEKSKA